MDGFWVIDTGFRHEGLARDLSNLNAYPFVLDEVQCGGIEGFLQSLKVEDPQAQLEIARLTGMEAYRAGQQFNFWKENQTLFWRGEALPRLSKKYQKLLERAYDACFDQCVEFATALCLSEDAILTHTMGKRNPSNTTLTEHEYMFNLYRLRARGLQMLRKTVGSQQATNR